ncbi:hypothetical protein ABRP83_13410 [Pectobacterium brasiliense]|uniref:hypothetical protein n=1 Tax=Pectobacterium brasiliense TaxID=180957 RepID=UPI0032EBC501
MDWLSLLSGALGGTVLTQGAIAFREYRNGIKSEQKEQARIAMERLIIATEVVPLLEQVVLGCLDVANDNCEAHGNTGEMVPSVSVPSLDFTDIKGDWRTFGELLYPIKQVPIELKNCKHYLGQYYSFHWNPPDHQRYFNMRALCYSRLGLRTSLVVLRLRRECGMPMSSLFKTEFAAYSALWIHYRRCIKWHVQTLREDSLRSVGPS